MRVVLFGTEPYAVPILRPLQVELQRRGHEVGWHLHGVDASWLNGGAQVFRSAREVMRYRPDAVLCASNWVPHFYPGLKVQVFHGFSVGKRSPERGHFRIRGMFDLYCTQGPSTTAPFAQLADRHGHFRVVETGWPKLDPLFATDHRDLRPHDGRAVIGYGATFTPRLASAEALLPEIRRLVRDGEWYWLLTLHPKSPPALIDQYRALAGANAFFVECHEVVDLLRAADVFVSDTSSILEEFAMQRRPVVTFRNRNPAPHMHDFSAPEALEAMVRAALRADAAVHDALDRNARDVHPYRDGASSARVIDAVEATLREPPRLGRKPLNPWRRLQARRELRYWRV